MHKFNLSLHFKMYFLNRVKLTPISVGTRLFSCQ